MTSVYIVHREEMQPFAEKMKEYLSEEIDVVLTSADADYQPTRAVAMINRVETMAVLIDQLWQDAIEDDMATRSQIMYGMSHYDTRLISIVMAEADIPQSQDLPKPLQRVGEQEKYFMVRAGDYFEEDMRHITADLQHRPFEARARAYSTMITTALVTFAVLAIYAGAAF